MCAFAPNIGNGKNHMRREFPLDAKVPLLDVRPLSLVRYGNDGERKEGHCPPASANARICTSSTGGTCALASSNVGLGRGQDKRRGAFERFSVALVAVGMFIEYAVAAANGRFAIAFGVKGEADAR